MTKVTGPSYDQSDFKHSLVMAAHSDLWTLFYPHSSGDETDVLRGEVLAEDHIASSGRTGVKPSRLAPGSLHTAATSMCGQYHPTDEWREGAKEVTSIMLPPS